jgi:putative Mg2+ transporter-C (MgtC) family protein
MIWAMHDLELFARILLASALGFGIGWEREVRGQPAGNRTFALVSLGAAAFTVLGVDEFPATAEKLIAGIVTGIGFIGAGVILHTDGGRLRGLTTAAAIWATAAIGILCGGDRLVLATAVAGLCLFLLEVRNIPLVRSIDADRWAERFASDPEERPTDHRN